MSNWLLDASCLYVCLAAYGGPHLGPEVVLTAYGFANLLGLLPLTPGGLGLVEGSLIPLLIALGGPDERRRAGSADLAGLPVLAAGAGRGRLLPLAEADRPDVPAVDEVVVKNASGSRTDASGTR